MKQKINNRIIKFLDKFISKHPSVEIEGVLVFGSVLDEEYFWKRSDVDIYVVIKNNGKRYRGVWMIDDIEFDYFVNPIEQLQSDFEMAIESDKKTILFMLAEGEILQDRDEQLLQLQNKAKEILSESVNEMTGYQMQMTKYFIDDYVKDIKDLMEIDDNFAWERNVNLLLNYLVEVFCTIHKIYPKKAKYQKEQFQKQDGEFVKLYEKIVQSKSQQERQKNVEIITKYMIDKLGGNTQKEWEVISDVKI